MFQGELLRRIGYALFAGALLACGLAPRPAQSQSPELWQLLNDANSQIKVLSPSIARGPVCAPAMLDMAKQGLQSNLASGALTKVVVEPLEQGAKLALGALGVPGLAISTYSMMRCALGASSPADFGKCALGEVIGFAGGAGLEKFGVDGLEGALAGWAWDKAYGIAKDAWDGWGQTVETWDFEAGGECEIRGSASWSKRPQPGAEGGVIRISITASNCKCPTGNSVKQGNVRVNVPVRYSPAGSRQPGFSAGTLQDIRVEATCCGNPGVDPNVYLYSPGGTMTGVVKPQDDRPPPAAKPPPRTPTGTGGAPPTTTPVPKPPPPTVAPKPKPVWPPAAADLSRVCPECDSYRDAIARLRGQLAAAEQRAADAQRGLSEARADTQKAEADVRRLQNELRAQEGTGGSAFDPDTGRTTSATTQADGTVRITVTDASGKVVEERTRERRDTAAVRKQLEDAERRLAESRTNEARLSKQLGDARVDAQRAAAALRTQEALYEECIDKCRRKVLFGEPAMGVALTVPLEFAGAAGAGVGGALPGSPAIGAAGAAGGVNLPPPAKPASKPPVADGASGGSIVSTLPGFLCPDCTSLALRLRDLRDDMSRREADIRRMESELRAPGEGARVAAEAGAPTVSAAEVAQRAQKLDPIRRQLSDAYRELTPLYRERSGLENELKDCLAKCKNFAQCDVEVERVVNVLGNNPFNPRDPLSDGQSSSSGSASVVPPASCSTTFTPKTFLSCSSNTCGFSTPFTLSVSSGAVTLNPLNSAGPPNGAVTFCNGTSLSNNLNILGLPAHRCSIFQVGPNIVIQCQNNFGAGPGSCSSFCN